MITIKKILKHLYPGSKETLHFLTGEEDQEKYNKEAFNHDENVRGEYIQIILMLVLC